MYRRTDFAWHDDIDSVPLQLDGGAKGRRSAAEHEGVAGPLTIPTGCITLNCHVPNGKIRAFPLTEALGVML
jgi:hypothetical protein